MTTKARRTNAGVMRGIARLTAQARLNAGDAASRGRTAEARDWQFIAEYLEEVLRQWRARGVARQVPLF